MNVQEFIKIATKMELRLPAKIRSKSTGDLTLYEIEKHIYPATDIHPIEFVSMIYEQRCRVCGCTQNDCSQCIEKTGKPCSWVEEDLCSACLDSKAHRRTSTTTRPRHRSKR